MTGEQPEAKKKAGSIRQYATLGKGKASESPNIQTSGSSDAQTLERRDTQELGRPNVEMVESLNAQELQRLNVETSGSLNAGTVESLNAQESKRQGVRVSERQGAGTSKRERERHTVYLPPDLSEWVKIHAIKTKREISEVVTEALEQYRREAL